MYLHWFDMVLNIEVVRAAVKVIGRLNFNAHHVSKINSEALQLSNGIYIGLIESEELFI